MWESVAARSGSSPICLWEHRSSIVMSALQSTTHLSHSPEVWNTLLAFAYRAADLSEGGGDLRTSSEEVKRQADKILEAPSVIKIIDSAPVRIIDRISLTQCCQMSTGVFIVQGLVRR